MFYIFVFHPGFFYPISLIFRTIYFTGVCHRQLPPLLGKHNVPESYLFGPVATYTGPHFSGSDFNKQLFWPVGKCTLRNLGRDWLMQICSSSSPVNHLAKPCSHFCLLCLLIEHQSCLSSQKSSPASSGVFICTVSVTSQVFSFLK